MKYIKENFPFIICTIFFVSLFYGIYSRIEGLGVVAIVAGIIFALYLMYYSYGGPGDSIRRIRASLVDLFNNVNNPVVWSLVTSLISAIIKFAKKNKNSLNETNSKVLERIIDLELKKFEENELSEFIDNDLPPSDDNGNHKKKSLSDYIESTRNRKS